MRPDTSRRPIGAGEEMSGGLAPPFLLRFPTLAGHLSRTPRKNEVSGQLSGFLREIPMRNACLDAALAELDAVGIRDRVIARGDAFRRFPQHRVK